MLLRHIRLLLDIRAFEARLHVAWGAGDLPATVHLSAGQEAIAAGMLAAFRAGDRVAATHRCHGVALALGLDREAVLAEIMGRTGALNAGRAGTQHLNDMDRGFLGGNGIVGASVGWASGAALAAQRLKTGAVAWAFTGDGAANQGQVLESLNLAAVFKLPLVIVLENNEYGEATRTRDVTAAESLSTRAAAFGLAVRDGDGADLEEMLALGHEARAHAASRGPVLVEARAPRLYGHYEGDNQAYRPPADGRIPGSERDAVTRARALARQYGIGADEFDALEAAAQEEADRLFRDIHARPPLAPATVYGDAP